MLQSRCISGCKSDSEFPGELHATGLGKGDLMVSGSRILLLKWTWYLSNGDVYARVPPCLWEEEQGACLFRWNDGWPNLKWLNGVCGKVVMAMNKDACIVLLSIFVKSISVGQLTLSFVWVSSVSNSAKWLRPREDPRSKSLRWSVLKVFACGSRDTITACFGLLAGTVEVKIWEQRFCEG